MVTSGEKEASMPGVTRKKGQMRNVHMTASEKLGERKLPLFNHKTKRDRYPEGTYTHTHTYGTRMSYVVENATASGLPEGSPRSRYLPLAGWVRLLLKRQLAMKEPSLSVRDSYRVFG